MLDPKVGERWWIRVDGSPRVLKVLEITTWGTYIVYDRVFFDGVIISEVPRSVFMCRHRGIVRRLIDRVAEFFAGFAR